MLCLLCLQLVSLTKFGWGVYLITTFSSNLADVVLQTLKLSRVKLCYCYVVFLRYQSLVKSSRANYYHCSAIFKDFQPHMFYNIGFFDIFMRESKLMYRCFFNNALSPKREKKLIKIQVAHSD